MRRRASSSTGSNDEHTEYVSWLGVPSLPKFNWNSAELRRRFIEGPDSVVGQWLAAPYGLDGWRIDVANMTGRYLDQDLNEEVRRTIRRTMLEVNPDTILLGESTNDASSDFQGDALARRDDLRELHPADLGLAVGAGQRRPVVLRPAVRHDPALHRRAVLRRAPRSSRPASRGARGSATMNALDTHDTPRFLTNAQPGHRAGRVRARR